MNLGRGNKYPCPKCGGLGMMHPDHLRHDLVAFDEQIESLAAEITRLRLRLAAWKAEAEEWRQWFDEEGGRFNDGCGCCSRETVKDSVYGNKKLMAARAATDAIEKNAS